MAEARDLGVVNGVQSYLVESNRSGSAIDRDAPEDNNGRWSSEANLQMKRGDRVSVECVAIESTGASNSGATIEFTGKNITRGHEKLNFTDDQCVLEFNFYIVNNQHNSCNLPIHFNNDIEIQYEDQAGAKVGLYLTGFPPDGADDHTVYPMPTPGGVPFGPNPGVGAVPNVVPGGESSHSYTWFQQQVNKGYYGGISDHWGVSNYSGGGQDLFGNAMTAPPTPLQEPSISSPCDYQFPGCGFTSQAGYNFNTNVGGIKIVSAYGLYQLRMDGIPVNGGLFPIPTGTQFNEIVINQPDDPNAGALYDNLSVVYDPETLPIAQNYDFGGVNLPFAQGMRVGFKNGLVLPPPWPAYQQGNFMSQPILSVGPDLDHYAALRTRALIKVELTTIPVGGTYEDVQGSCELITVINRILPDGDSELPKTYGGYSAKPTWFSDINADPLVGNDYSKQGRMGIGLYNQSAQNNINSNYTPNEPPAPSTPATVKAGFGGVPSQIDQAKRWSHMRGGSVLWEQARDYTAWGSADNFQVPQEGINRIGTTDPNAWPTPTNPLSGQGLLPKTCDMRNFKDNAPYILTRPDYMGPQPHPNGMGLCPKLEPLSCFVHVKAGSAFEDVSALAAIFTEAFHAINKLLTSTGNDIQKYINESDYPFNKKSQIFPLFTEGWFAANACEPSLSNDITTGGAAIYGEPPGGFTAINQPALFKKVAKWNKAAPMWLGNCVKCIPANLDIGTDWKYQEGSPYFYWLNDLKDYLKTGEKNDWLWNNQVYGNMGLKDMNNCRAGDILCRLEVWDGNTTIHPHRDIPRTVILNTQLEKQRVKSVNQGWKLGIEYPAPFPAGNPLYGRTNSHYEAASFQFWGTRVSVGDIIFTNTEYENSQKYWENMPGADITTLTGYSPDATPEQIEAIRLVRYKNLDDIQRAMRMNEKYMIENNPYVTNGQKNQQAQPWWVYNMDVGMSDCSQRLNSNQIGAGQPYIQPIGNGTGTAADGRMGIMTPIQTNWTQDPAAAAVPGTGGFPASANQNPYPIVTKPYFAGVPPTAWPLQTDNQPIPPLADQTQFDLPRGSTFITPSQSISGTGVEIDFQQATEQGRLQVFSKWNTQWEIPISTQQASGQQAPWQNDYVPFNRYEGGVPTPGSCNLYDDIAPFPWIYDYTESKIRDIGAFPYLYTDESGTDHKFIAWVVSKEHNAINSGLDAALPIDYKNASATWTLGDITWGDFFGFSPAFGYDQPALIPTNNDVITNQTQITFSKSVPAVEDVNVNPNTSHKPNNINHVWVGANNASMTFDPNKNRFELGGLYTSNTLNMINGQSGPIVAPAIPNSQIGEQIATLNGNDNDTVMTFNQNNPIGIKQNAGQGIHQSQKVPGVYDWNPRNQGVQDSISGICLANIYHCPQNWKSPDELNPQNLTSPYMNNASGLEDPYSRDASLPAGARNLQTFKNRTEDNYKTFTDTLTLATADNWQGTILNKMGFDYEQLIPYVGSQSNRYSQWTYGKSDITIQEQGVKPLILNSELDTAATLDLNTYHQRTDALTSMTGELQVPEILGPFPTYGGPYGEGSQLYRTGTLNNDTINLDASTGSVLTARNQPSLYACPYYIIMTNLVSTTFQKGKMAQNAIYYGLKSYSAGQYFYVYASGYSQLVQADRLVQSITTELRNPLTGEIARVGPNSSIIYKIDRDISLPEVSRLADGTPVDIPSAIAQISEEDEELHKGFEKMFEKTLEVPGEEISMAQHIRVSQEEMARQALSLPHMIHVQPEALETKSESMEHHSTNWRTRQSREAGRRPEDPRRDRAGILASERFAGEDGLETKGATREEKAPLTLKKIRADKLKAGGSIIPAKGVEAMMTTLLPPDKIRSERLKAGDIPIQAKGVEALMDMTIPRNKRDIMNTSNEKRREKRANELTEEGNLRRATRTAKDRSKRNLLKDMEAGGAGGGEEKVEDPESAAPPPRKRVTKEGETILLKPALVRKASDKIVLEGGAGPSLTEVAKRVQKHKEKVESRAMRESKQTEKSITRGDTVR